MTSSDQSPASVRSCANCLAEFEWAPFVQDGEEFCCSGCAEGGPCICTYAGPPDITAHQRTPVQEPGTRRSSASGGETGEVTEEVERAVAAEADSGVSLQPVDDDEPPTNGRLAIILAAISEMPYPVQEVLRARISNPGSDQQIGEPLGLDGEEVRELIEQGQAILDRTLGSGFRVRYIGTDEIPAGVAEEPSFPSFDAAEPEPLEPKDEIEIPPAPSDASVAQVRSELGQLIARSIDSLTAASAREGVDNERAGEVVAEALREVGNLFGLAAQRIGAEEPPQQTLREALVDARDAEDAITVVIENGVDVAEFVVAVQQHDSVRWAKLQSHTPERTELRLVISSMMAFVRDMMTMEGAMRPTRLQMSGNEITVEMPEEVKALMPVTPTGPPASQLPASPHHLQGRGPLIELSVESFFGARHFIESDTGASSPHHHSYRVEASFITPEPDRQGFAIGFANVRDIVESTVMKYSETLLNTEQPFRNIPPTTENLARVFFEQVSEKVVALGVPNVRLGRLRVWESPTNSATYSIIGAQDAAAAS